MAPLLSKVADAPQAKGAGGSIALCPPSTRGVAAGRGDSAHAPGNAERQLGTNPARRVGHLPTNYSLSVVSSPF